MNKKQIKDLALSNGFKLKEQPSGEMDLNPYVYEFASALIAKANERVKELKKELAKKELLHVGFTNGDQIKNGVVEEGSFYPDTKGCCYIPLYMLKSHEHRIETTSIEQLHKEQENG